MLLTVITIIKLDAGFLLKQIGLPPISWHPNFLELTKTMQERNKCGYRSGNDGLDDYSRIACRCEVFLRYSVLLDLEPVALLGKKVLDAGCGPDAEFVRYCLENGIADAKGCDVSLSSTALSSYPGNLYKCDYRALPESIRYDYIFCVASYDPRDGAEPLVKFLKVIKPEGEIRIYPIHLADHWDRLGEGKCDWMKVIGSLGVAVEYEFRATQVDIECCPDICEVLIIRNSAEEER